MGGEGEKDVFYCNISEVVLKFERKNLEEHTCRGPSDGLVEAFTFQSNSAFYIRRAILQNLNKSYLHIYLS